MSKLTLHLIGPPEPGFIDDYLALSGAGCLKGLNWYPAIAGIQTIGRIFMDQTREPEPLGSMIRAGANGADQLFGYVWPEIEKNSPDIIWELYNEPPMDAATMAGFVAFSQRLKDRARAAGRRLSCGMFSTSWPQPAQMETLARACQGYDALSLHEYHTSDMSLGGDCTHYRAFHDWCQAHGYQHPPIYITECGLDKMGGPDHGHYGWKTIIGGNQQEYVRQLIAYERQLRLDDYVRAATVFTTGGGWPEFEFGRDVAMLLAQALHDLGPGPEPPPPDPEPIPPAPVGQWAKGFYASEYQGAIDWDRLWDDGYRYVHIRASSGLHKDALFESNWDRAGTRGFLRDAWHRVSQADNGQAAFFKSVVGARVPEMGIYGDCEGDCTHDKAGAFLEAADRNFGTTCGVYASAGWMGGDVPTWATGRDLWVGSWTNADKPVLPTAFKAWEFWQWHAGMAIPGIENNALPDRFFGTIEGLRQKYGGEEPEPPPVGGNVKFCDKNGNEISEAKFRSVYGDSFQVQAVAGSKYHLAEVWDSGLDVGMDCQVYVRPSYPAGARVMRQDGGTFPGTDKPGYQEITFDACYAPPSVGAYTVYINDPNALSDRVTGLGWICMTSHRHPQRLVFDYGEAPPPVTNYVLTTHVSGQGTISPAGGTYPAGTVVALRATAASGWHFAGWSGALTGTTNPANLTMNANKDVTATFSQDEPPPDDRIEQAIALIESAQAKLISADEDLAEALVLLRLL
jgi:GH25 family lysozyme M1 (1,4-beta-N-acetylmuramidase)